MDLPAYMYRCMRISVRIILEEIMTQKDLSTLVHNSHILVVEINKSMQAIPQVGAASRQGLRQIWLPSHQVCRWSRAQHHLA
jgi:hypothetical protein